MMLAFPWNLVHLLGGLLILLDSSTAAIVPLSASNSKPPRPNKPLTNGAAGQLISAVNANLGSPLSLTSFTGNSAPAIPHTVQQQQQQQPIIAPSSPAAPASPSTSLPAAIPQTPPVPTASSTQLSSPQAVPPTVPLPGSSGPSVTFGLNNGVPRPPAYGAGASQNAVGNSQSHYTYSQHSGGNSPVMVVVQQSVNDSLGPSATHESISQGLDQILTSVSPSSNYAEEPQQLLTEHINTAEDQVLHTVQHLEQNQVSNGMAHNVLQQATVSAPASSPSENEIDEDEETPQFNLEAYLAQAANYYPAPPTAQVATSGEDLITAPKPPALSVDELIPNPSIPPSLESVPSTLSAATDAIAEAVTEQQNLFSPPPSPATITLSSSNNNGQSMGESVVIVTTAGSFGTDSVHVVSNGQTPQAQSAVSVSPQQTSIIVNNDVGQQQILSTASVPTAPAEGISSDIDDTLETAVPGTAGYTEPVNYVIPSAQASPATPPHVDVIPAVPATQVPVENSQSTPMIPIIMHETNGQHQPEPNTDSSASPVSHSPLEQSPTPQADSHNNGPVSTSDAPSAPPSNTFLASPVDQHDSSHFHPPPHQHQPPPENGNFAPAHHPDFPQNVEVQTIIPVNQELPSDSDPSNIIFEATITHSQSPDGLHHPDIGEPPSGEEAPPPYIFIPINLPPDAQGTLTISAVPLEPSHEIPHEIEQGIPPATLELSDEILPEGSDDEEYPPFNVEQYLAQAALLLGSPQYGPQSPENLEQQLYASENFQSSAPLQEGGFDGAIHIIPPPSLIAELPASLSMESSNLSELAGLEPNADAPIELQMSSIPTEVGKPQAQPEHNILPNPAIIVPVEASDAMTESGPPVYQHLEASPVAEESILAEPFTPILALHDAHPLGSLPQVADEAVLGSPDHDLIHPSIPISLVDHDQSHIAPLLDNNLNSSEELPTLLYPNPEGELSDNDLLNNSALEALAAESENDIGADNTDGQSFIPVYLLSIPPSENISNEMQSDAPSPSLENSAEGLTPDNLQNQNVAFTPMIAFPSENNGTSNEEIQWTFQPVNFSDPTTMNEHFSPQQRFNSSYGFIPIKGERSRPMRPIGSLGLIGRPSAMGIAPMHSYNGGKLNNIMAQVPMPSMEDGKFSSGLLSSKHQNNGTYIMHDNRNPQNGMLSLMGNTIFNSHVSGDQPSQFAVPANAASFIMAQGQKLPFHLSPSFDSILQSPHLSGLSSNIPQTFSNSALPNNPNNPHTNNNQTPQSNPSGPSSQYSNYYYPEDSVRNATVLIHNGMMRPLISPLFLVVSNSEQGTGPVTDVKVIPEDYNNQFNSTNNISVVSIASDNNNSKVEVDHGSQEMTNGTANIHLIKRTAVKPPSKSLAKSNISSPDFLSGIPVDLPNPEEDSIKSSSEGAITPIDNALKGDQELPQHKIAEEEKEGEIEEEEEAEEGEESVEEEESEEILESESPSQEMLQEAEQQEPQKENTHDESVKEKPATSSKPQPQDKEPSQGQKANPPEAPLKDKQTPSKTQEKSQPAPPQQEAPPPRAPPPKEGPPPSSGPSGPSLPQPPPAPSLVGLPTVPDAISVPGGLGELAIPEPNINAPTVPVPSVSIPAVPKPLGDTKGLGKGPSGGKAKPPKKPNQNQPKGSVNGNATQNPQQPTNIAPNSQPPPVPVPTPPQQQQPQPQPQPVLESVEASMQPMNLQNDEPQSMLMTTEDVAEDEDEEEMDDEDETEEKLNESEIIGGELPSPPSIPTIPTPTIEKALPGKYGNGGVSGNGKPSVVPSLAAFSAPYTSNSPAPGGSVTASGTYSNQPNADKGCTCNNPNNNGPSSSSSGNNTPSKNDNYGGNSGPSSSGSRPKPAPPQAASQVEEPVDLTDDSEQSSVRPPRPNKPKRPNKPHAGNKKPKPKQPGEKNADRLKDTGEQDEDFHDHEHMKLVAVLTKPNLVAGLEDSKNHQKEVEDNTSSNDSDQDKGGEEGNAKKPNLPIRVTFVNNSGKNKEDSKPTGLGGPIKVTFVSSSGNKDDKKSVAGSPVKVTFVSSGGAGESENGETLPIKITVVSNSNSNGTKDNGSATVSPDSKESESHNTPEGPPPAKQQAELLTSVNWWGWEIPTLNWNYFTDLFNSFFGKNFRTNSGEFTCDESEEESSVLRSELDVDYLCGGDDSDSGRTDLDSNVCNLFCTSNGFYSGACMPLKSCLCYMSEDKNFAIKLDLHQEYNSNNNQTERVPNIESEDDFLENTCQNCRCLKSCQNHGKYVGYCSKSCHCGVPWYNESPNGKVQPT